MKYSGLFKRLVAFAVDILVIIGIHMLLGLIFGLGAVAGALVCLPMMGFWFYGGMIVIAWLYFAFFESSSLRATIGKKLLGLQVVTERRGKLSFLRASARYVVRVLTFIPVITIIISWLMIVFTKKKQAIHDKVTSTVVILRKE